MSSTDSLDLDQIRDLRIENDFEESTGYVYSKIGSDDIVDAWIRDGIDRGYLNDDWIDQLERLMLMSRQDANRILMDELVADWI